MTNLEGYSLLKFKKIFSCILALTTFLGGNMTMVNAVGENNTSKYAHVLDEQAYSGNDLGAVYSKSSTTFKVWAPSASGVALKLYQTGSSSKELSVTSMTKGDKGVWSITLNGDRKNMYYTYLVTVDGVTRETADIYARAAGVNGNKSMVVDLAGTNPQGWDKDKHILCDNPTDAVVWEVHVRDFSVSEVSGISDKNKGKYLAFTENGTSLNGEGKFPTCIEYLKQLGVTHVQLLPVYDYATVDESDTASGQFNWGYDPKNYNVPEGSYSTDPFDGNVRINEFKQMIMALHNAGIGVIMDVVYNHMYAAKGSWFDNTVPDYYFRQKPDGTLSDGSGCGNETASEHLMYRKFMTDSILYWVNEYHIDGFRFDLMGVHDVETMNGIRKALDTQVKDGSKIIMYGEPWTGGALGTSVDTCVKSNIQKLDNRIGAFNDNFRDAVKGHVFNALEEGFIQNGSEKASLQAGITANTLTNIWANQPSQAVSYTSAHDNYTLYDKLVLSVKNDMSYDKRDETLVDMNKMAAALTLTSQGISFMQAGEEFARTKQGDDNSYVSPDSINKLDWNHVKEYADLVSYYAGLIEIRKNFKPFRDPATTSAKLIQFSDTDKGIIAYTLENTLTPDTEWKYIAVAVNANDTSATAVLLPKDGKALPKQWTVIADKSEAGVTDLGTVTGTEITLPPRSAMILVDKESFDQLVIPTQSCAVKAEYKDTDSGEIIFSKTVKGKEGSAYSLSDVCDDMIRISYDLESVSGNTEGTFTKERQTVTYHCKKFDGNICRLTVNYLQAGNEFLGNGDKEAAPAFVQLFREGNDYLAEIKNIDGMELDVTQFPANAAGTAGKENITVTYHYIPKSKTDLIVHYFSEKPVNARLYRQIDSNIKEYANETMKPDTELGENWYTVTVKDAGDLDNMYVTFGNSDKTYSVKGTVWIRNDTTEYSGTIHVISLKADGTFLSSETLTDKIGQPYNIPAADIPEGMKLIQAIHYAPAEYTETPAYVICMYDEQNALPEEFQPDSSHRNAALILTATSILTLGAAGIAYLLYRRQKKRTVL